ncbi:replication protein A 70 kDa DNA-binding subunit B-like isoform X1 [Coffea arabica]|nr:replication protein A 70 kDa DNA-binding subunit B-like [Coffea arabica]XP_027113676.1 replication protein A 70 kDa DNA-binding subunit B-like [Coffea arabica]
MWSEHADGMLRLPEVNACLVRWTSQVQLIEASHVKTTCGSELTKKFRYFVFSDFQGVKVTALTIDENIDRVSDVLVPFKKYRVSKARVYEIPDSSLSVGSYRFYWVLTNDTVIDELIEIDPPKLPCYFRLRSIASCDAVADTENFIDIMGIVLCAFPAREVYFEGGPSVARDYVIVNYELRPVILTLWNEFEAIEGADIMANIAQNPVLICIRLRVTTDNYLSLSTQSSSVILVSPIVQEAGNLRAWFQANKSDLTQMVHERSYANSCVLVPPVASSRISQISFIAQATKFDIGTAWIRGTVSLEYRKGRLWYLACPHCYLPNDFSLNWGIMCRYCSRDIYTFPRACVTLAIKDGTGSLNVIAMGDEAEKLIGINSHRLYQADKEDVHLTDRVASALNGRVMLFYLKHSDHAFRVTKGARYTIVASYDVNDAEAQAA